MHRIVIDKVYETIGGQNKAFNLTHKLLQEICSEGVIEKQKDLALGERKSDCIAFRDNNWRPRRKTTRNSRHITTGNLSQTWGELNPRNASKWKFAGHDHCAAFAASEIDNVKFICLSMSRNGP